MPMVHLEERTCLTVSGPEAEHFLQNLITTDLAALGTDEVKPGALLTPQGKIMFDFLISRMEPEGFRIDLRSDTADDLVKRLTLYKLRARVEISKQDQTVVMAGWEIDSCSSENDSIRLHDRRFSEGSHVHRIYGGTGAGDATLADWTLLRIRNGIAESGTDYALSDAFPHDVLLDQNGGVGLRKGCYVGQEVVSRMHHRGTARRRVMIAGAESDLAEGSEVTAGGRAIGTLGSARGAEAIAIVRIDRVAAAMEAGEPILAGETPITLSVPDWATYTLPHKDDGKTADAG